MTKFRKSLILFGCIILCVAGALAAFFAMSFSGLITSDPIEITLAVTEDEKVYDGTPLTASQYSVVSGELLSGDEFKVSYTGSQTEVGISSCGMDVKVLDSAGRDVSKNYAVKVLESTLEVTKRPILAVQENVTREYTGEPVDGGNYNVSGGELVNGHRIARVSAADGANAVNCGEYKDTLGEPRIYDANGIDVTYNYYIEYIRGSISVEKRKLQIELVSAEKTYDGIAVMPSYKITGGSLVSGDEIDVRYTVNGLSDPSFIGMTKPDTVQLGIDGVRITDENGKDVSDNYSVSRANSSATLTITPRALRVVGASDSWVYDGTLHSTVGADTLVTGLCSTDRVKIEYTSDIINVGVKANEFTVTVYHGEEGEEEANDCYDIEKVEKNIEVTPLTATVLCSAQGKTYDGEPLELTLESLLGGPYGYTDSITFDLGEEIAGIDTAALKEQCRSSLTAILPDGEIKNAGTYYYSLGLTENSNFVLSGKSGGSVTIYPKPVFVTPNEVIRIYSGEEYKFLPSDVADIVSGEGQPALQEELNCLLLSIDGNKTVKNAGIYSYTVRTDETRLNSQNYTVQGTPNGEITVNPKTLEIKAKQTVTKTYTGEEISLSFDEAVAETTVTEAEKFYLKVSADSPVVDAKDYKFTITVQGTGNYIIDQTASGTLTVTPKVINVTTKDVIKTYNGSAFSFNADDVALTTATQAEKSVLKVTVSDGETVCNAGDYAFGIEINQGVRGYQNYKLEGKLDGSITVAPKEIKISAPNVEKTYDGKEVEISVDSVVPDGVSQAERELLTVFKNQTMLNAGSYTFNVRLNAEAEGVNNYKLTGDTAGSVIIQPAQLNITTKKIDRTYSGSTFSFALDEAIANLSELSDASAYLTVSTDGLVCNAGDYAYTIKVEGTGNYVINGTAANLITVSKKLITFENKDVERTYYGGTFTLLLEDVAASTLTSEQRDNLTVTTFAGTDASDSYSYTVTLREESKSNYDFDEITDGRFTVLKKQISVTLKDVERQYSGIEYELSEAAFGDLAVTSATEEEIGELYFYNVTQEPIENVGTYYFSVDFTGNNNNYELTGSLTGSIKITPKPIRVSVSGNIQSLVYEVGGKEIELEKVATVIDADDVELAVSPARVYNAGTYSFSVVFADESNALNYVLQGATTGSITVDPKPITVNVKNISKNYNGSAYTLTLNELIENYSEISDAADYLKIVTAGTVLNADTYAYGIEVAGTGNYVLVNAAAGTVTVNPATFDLDYNGSLTKTYNGKPLELDIGKFTATANIDVRINVSSVIADMGGADAGSKTINISQVLLRNSVTGEDVTKNFTFSGKRLSGNIDKLDLRIVFDENVTVAYSVFRDTKDWSGYAKLASDTLLAEGDRLVYAGEGNAPSNIWTVNAEQSGTKAILTVDINSFKIMRGTQDVTANYNIITATGYVNIDFEN